MRSPQGLNKCFMMVLDVIYFQAVLCGSLWGVLKRPKSREFNWISLRVQVHTSPMDQWRESPGEFYPSLQNESFAWFSPLEIALLSNRRWCCGHRTLLTCTFGSREKNCGRFHFSIHSEVQNLKRKKVKLCEKKKSLKGWLHSLERIYRLLKRDWYSSDGNTVPKAFSCWEK